MEFKYANRRTVQLGSMSIAGVERRNGEYRRKPAPKYVPWTREDADQFRGIWVRSKDENGEEQQLTRIHSLPLNSGYSSSGEPLKTCSAILRSSTAHYAHCGRESDK